jgi:hypothetical protein
MRNEAIVLGFSTPQKEAIWDWGISGQDTRLFATKLPFARSESRRTPVSALGSDCWVRYGSIDRLMCAHFSVGLTLLLHHLWNRATPFSPGVTACLKQDDFAETCGQKSIFPLLSKKLNWRRSNSALSASRSPRLAGQGSNKSGQNGGTNDDKGKDCSYLGLGDYTEKAALYHCFKSQKRAGKSRISKRPGTHRGHNMSQAGFV